MDDETFPWHKRAAELCQRSGKVKFLEKLLTRRLTSTEKLVYVTDFPVVAGLLSLAYSTPSKAYYHSAS